MATLKLTFNGEKIQDIPLTQESLIIGRKPDSDIHIDNLSVSGHHAKILTILNDSFIEDLKSTNGTYVNGTLIQKQPLTNGDVIRIGKHELIYSNEGTDAPDFERTMIIRPDAEGLPENEGDSEFEQSVSKIAAEIATKDSGAQAATGSAKIRLMNGANSGKELPLTKVLTTLGKPGVQVAAITRRPTGYYLLHVDGGDNASRPTINDQEIGVKAEVLNNRDIIEVAGVKMEFLLD